MFILTNVISSASHFLSWTSIETTMLIIAVVWHMLWTGGLIFGGAKTSSKGSEEKESSEKENEPGESQTVSLQRAQVLRCERPQYKVDVSNDVQKLCRSGTFLTKQVEFTTSKITSHGEMSGYDVGQWRTDGNVVANALTLPPWPIQLFRDDPLLLHQPHRSYELFQISRPIHSAQSVQRLMQYPSVSLYVHLTPWTMVCEVLQLNCGQHRASMRVTLALPIANLFSSWMRTTHEPDLSILGNRNSTVVGLKEESWIVSNTTGLTELECVENAQSSQEMTVMELETEVSNSLQLELHGGDDVLPDSSQPAFIRHPDGSLMLAAPLEYMESPPPTPSRETLTATSQLRETARALRNAVEREIAADKLRRATARQGLLRRLLLSEVLLNFVSGAICVGCGTMHLLTPNWEVSVSSLLKFWWTWSISTCFVGFLATRSARERVFSMLSALALASAVGQMWLACAVMNAVYPDGPPAAIIGALSVLLDLPLRLAVGSQAWLGQIDLRYLLMVRSDIFMSIDTTDTPRL